MKSKGSTDTDSLGSTDTDSLVLTSWAGAASASALMKSKGSTDSEVTTALSSRWELFNYVLPRVSQSTAHSILCFFRPGKIPQD